MSDNKPFISVVIPTRNRPELLKYALQSLLLQTFTDFEVIVSDNHTGKPCRTVFDQYADQRFKYVTPQSPLLMHDNWQFACNFAQGEYITVLMDKSIFRPSALQIINNNLTSKPVEIISWWHELFFPHNEDAGYENGTYLPSHIKQTGPQYYDPKTELTRRISCSSSVKSDAEGGCYYWGKICFGAYHKNLVRRINSALGKLFFAVSPDYTSMVAALAFAESAVDIGEPLTLTTASKLSNGSSSLFHPEHALSFLHEIDPTGQIVQNFPIKGLYASIHNSVAYDYAVMKDKIGKPMQNMQLNMKNLVLLAKDDLDNVIWKDCFIRENQMGIWLNSYRALSLQQRLTILLSCRLYLTGLSAKLNSAITFILDMLPNIKNRLKATFHKQTGISCKTIFDAAKIADDLYKQDMALFRKE